MKRTERRIQRAEDKLVPEKQEPITIIGLWYSEGGSTEEAWRYTFVPDKPFIYTDTEIELKWDEDEPKEDT
jgi:hypothetical protein